MAAASSPARPSVARKAPARVHPPELRALLASSIMHQGSQCGLIARKSAGPSVECDPANARGLEWSRAGEPSCAWRLGGGFGVQA
jgi:hypothetical protein